MKYTAGQAAKAVGKSVPTITRAIAKGKISAEKTGTGGYLIDASELHRVFPVQATPLTTETVTNPNLLRSETFSADNVLQSDVMVLSERLRLLEIERERERLQLLDQILDLQTRLDREGEERRALSIRLLAAPAPSIPSRRPWWSWSKGRG